MANDTFAPSEEEQRMLLAQLAQLLQSSGAGNLMQMGGGGQFPAGANAGQPQQPGANLFAPPQRVPGIQNVPVGGPANPNLADSFGPRGTIFLGGSPFKPDFGPARLQNSLVFAKELLDSSQAFAQSDMGRALSEKLKGLFGSK